MPEQSCPVCGLLNPPTAQRCDCGYDFAAGAVKKSFLQIDRVVTAASPNEIVKLARDQRLFVRLLLFEVAFIPLLVLVLVILQAVFRDEFVMRCVLVAGISFVMIFHIVLGFVFASNLDTLTRKVALGATGQEVDGGFGPFRLWRLNLAAVRALNASGVQARWHGVSKDDLQKLPQSLEAIED